MEKIRLYIMSLNLACKKQEKDIDKVQAEIKTILEKEKTKKEKLLKRLYG